MPDFLQTRKNGGILRKNAVLFELWAGSNQLWPKRVGMSAIPCGVWVSGLSQSGLKRPAPEVNLPKSYNTRNQLYLTVPWVRIPLAPPSRACNQADYRLFPFSKTGNSVLFHFFGEKIIRSPQHQTIPTGFRSRRPPVAQALPPSPVPR